MDDFLGRDDLQALGLETQTIDRLLNAGDLRGHDKQPIIETDRLDELLQMLAHEDDLAEARYRRIVERGDS